MDTGSIVAIILAAIAIIPGVLGYITKSIEHRQSGKRSAAEAQRIDAEAQRIDAETAQYFTETAKELVSSMDRGFAEVITGVVLYYLLCCSKCKMSRFLTLLA